MRESTSPAPLPPALQATFESIRLLGTGGMGAVWLVRDRFLDRFVALKVLLPDQASAEHRERFLREARTSARLEHPHIIDVYRADETDGVVWFTMRYVNGESLGDRLRERGAIPVSDTVRILREVAWGLAYAHARGVVHRDIKPDNILIERESGRVVVTDFGIARDTVNANGLTLDGHVLGSVHYMSPEQISGEEIDGRSDVYALGCVGYHALGGAPPFDGTAQSVLVAHVTRPIPSLSTQPPHIPPSVVAVIEKCLAKDPASRYASADAVAAALDAALRDAEAHELELADASPGSVLSEENALAVWQRAAQLQAEAAHRMERAAALKPATTTDSANTVSGQYRMRDVEAAAVEAGISKQYVALAVAEVKARAASGQAVRVSSEAEDRRLTLFMGTSDRAMSVSRVIPGAPKEVLASLGQVLTNHACKLQLLDTVNGHPLDGGIMRFRMPRFAQAYWNPFSASTPELALGYRLEQIELRDLNVTLQPRGTAHEPACEVIITGDLREGLRANMSLDYTLMAVAGAAGGLGLALGAAKLAGSGSPLVYAMGAVGLLLGAGACFAWYRWLFRDALKNAGEQLSKLLQSVEQQLTQQRLFSGQSTP